MAILNISINKKCSQGSEENGTLVQSWWECRLVQPLWKRVWNFLKKQNMELPFEVLIPLLAF